MEKTIIQLQGMTCFACEKLISNRLKRLSNIESVEVSLDNQQALVLAKRKITAEEVQQALQGTKYTIVSVI